MALAGAAPAPRHAARCRSAHAGSAICVGPSDGPLQQHALVRQHQLRGRSTARPPGRSAIAALCLQRWPVPFRRSGRSHQRAALSASSWHQRTVAPTAGGGVSAPAPVQSPSSLHRGTPHALLLVVVHSQLSAPARRQTPWRSRSAPHFDLAAEVARRQQQIGEHHGRHHVEGGKPDQVLLLVDRRTGGIQQRVETPAQLGTLNALAAIRAIASALSRTRTRWWRKLASGAACRS